MHGRVSGSISRQGHVPGCRFDTLVGAHVRGNQSMVPSLLLPCDSSRPCLLLHPRLLGMCSFILGLQCSSVLLKKRVISSSSLHFSHTGRSPPGLPLSQTSSWPLVTLVCREPRPPCCGFCAHFTSILLGKMVFSKENPVHPKFWLSGHWFIMECGRFGVLGVLTT